MIRLLLAMVIVFTAVGASTSARADGDSDTAAITNRLQRWTQAFNARDAAGVCDVFSPDLISTVPEALDGSRDALCGRLSAVLAKPELQLHYDSPDIREIIVSGDIAIVRLFWTLTAQKAGESSVSTEAGMDIFKRQRDGKWSIARFISFSATPNKVLQ
ncbi:nuclear transport factor 2 family protein [Paraburkholderia xenovorans]|uniref:YybH family protein n=1 Tax=Paraburkholderia xenovorans TaxID=36873 RepID=UPI0038B7168F